MAIRAYLDYDDEEEVWQVCMGDFSLKEFKDMADADEYLYKLKQDYKEYVRRKQ